MDHPVMNGAVKGCEDVVDIDSRSIYSYPTTPTVIDWLIELKQVARETNERWADALRINRSKQLTLIKPSGTVSQLCDTASGIHPRMFPYYIRRVTQDIKDPLTQLLIDQKVPHTTAGEKVLFEFPVKAPEYATTSKDISALEQLELWKIYREYWCEGNPSQTIYYTDDDYFAVADWVWKNWDIIGGLSFFPKDDHVYTNAPYQEITQNEYEKLAANFPTIDYSKLPEFEHDDTTTCSNEYACAGGKCEL